MQRRAFALVLCGVLLMVLASGCSAPEASGPTRLHGAIDLMPLAESVTEHLSATGVQIIPAATTSGLDDLREGTSDAVLLGYEPTEEELAGLTSHIVAYDAVCILIDANSFKGGEWHVNPAPGPVRKTDGLQRLASKDVEGLLSLTLKEPKDRWVWAGPYFKWISDDPIENPQKGRWEPEMPSVRLSVRTFPGKFDTQTQLYRALGIDEHAAAQTWHSFSAPQVTSEEQLLASIYPNEFPLKAGSGDFVFAVGFASRRVTQIALDHAPVRVVTIDGMDPINNVTSVYSGQYPFARAIRVVTRSEASPGAASLVELLLSPEGQQLVAQSGFLPLAP